MMHAEGIYFHNKELEFNLPNQPELKKWIFDSIINEGFTPGALDFSFMNDDALLKINQEHLGHDFYTDIITFEYNENGILAGDILISIDRVKENANQFSGEFTEELHRVMIHGILHLCGYKDKTDAERVNMRAKEDYYLSLRSF